jgi:predicted GNAT family N-acyltransferase
MEEQAKKSSQINIILDAREAAVDFYKTLGYTAVKKSYLLFDLIQHYRMTKKL